MGIAAEEARLKEEADSKKEEERLAEEAKAVHQYIVAHSVLPVTENWERTSAEIARLEKHTKIKVLEFSTADDGRVRARIENPNGWISAWMEDRSFDFIVHQEADDDTF